MRFPFLASSILLVLILAYNIKKNTRQTAKAKTSYFEKERIANSTRRKSLDTLDYIVIPLDKLPMELASPNEAVEEYTQTIRRLASCKIVNFTGISNTDLKLRYGVSNLSLLIDFDQNYINLVATLQRWALALFKEDHLEEAKTVLEYAVSVRSDVSGTYKLLASIYLQENQPQKIAELIQKAETLNSITKTSIVRALKESDPYTC